LTLLEAVVSETESIDQKDNILWPISDLSNRSKNF